MNSVSTRNGIETGAGTGGTCPGVDAASRRFSPVDSKKRISTGEKDDRLSLGLEQLLARWQTVCRREKAATRAAAGSGYRRGITLICGRESHY